jgi:hypothetical protein
MSEGLYKILPNIQFNPIQEVLEGGTRSGILSMIFPNGEAMFSWFKSLNEDSLKHFSIVGRIKGPTFNLDKNITSPIGIPNIAGVTGRVR